MRCLGFLSVLIVVALFPQLTPAQDADGDGVSDASDLCVNVINPLQSDADGDLVGDVCDCAPADSLETGALGPARNLAFVSNTMLTWEIPLDLGGGPGVGYDLLRVTSPDDFLSATCVAANLSVTSTVDPTVPGGIFFYLIRAQGICGGNLGSDILERRRRGRACPPGNPLSFCTETFDLTCPSINPVCGANFNNGLGCLREFKAFCYDSGIFSYKVTVAAPLEIIFDDDLTSLTVFLVHENVASGTMRFFDADNLEVDSPLMSNGNCLMFMPPRQTLNFSRPVRRATVTAVSGVVWLDTFTVN